jgi:hypothetical protein
MESGSKVIAPPSLSSILDANDVVEEEEDIITGLFEVRCSLRCDALAKFDYLMETVTSRDETIEESTTHIEYVKRGLNPPKQELSDEKNTTFLLNEKLKHLKLIRLKTWKLLIGLVYCLKSLMHQRRNLKLLMLFSQRILNTYSLLTS